MNSRLLPFRYSHILFNMEIGTCSKRLLAKINSVGGMKGQSIRNKDESSSLFDWHFSPGTVLWKMFPSLSLILLNLLITLKAMGLYLSLCQLFLYCSSLHSSVLVLHQQMPKLRKRKYKCNRTPRHFKEISPLLTLLI